MDENQKKEVADMIALAIKTHLHNGVLAQLIYLNNIFGYKVRWADILNLPELNYTLNVRTNGTTPVNAFQGFAGNATPTSFEISLVSLMSLDTTAATITIKKNSSTVATIAKGTVAGAFVGATSASNLLFNPGDVLSVVSSSAGNAVVKVEVLFPIS